MQKNTLVSKKESDVGYSGVTSIIRAQVSAGLSGKSLRPTYLSFFKFPVTFLCGLFIPISDLPKILRLMPYVISLPKYMYTDT